ncbi:MAG: signal peptidase II [Nanoarchaeota archaeon]|nr:signal peptidase II [Nanoarchaeota archaeon]
MKRESAVHLLLFLGIVILDLATKYTLSEGCLWKFCVSRAFNTGASFGIFDGMTSLFIVVAAMVLVVMAYLYEKSNARIKLAFVFIGAGTIGNLINRVFLGGVIDLFRIFNSSSFNLADLSNLIGGIILLFIVFFDGKQEQKKTFKA